MSHHAQPLDAFEGNGPQRPPKKRLDRRLEEVAKAVGGGYYRLQMPSKLALGVRETLAEHRVGALGGSPPPLPMPPWPSPKHHEHQSSPAQYNQLRHGVWYNQHPKMTGTVVVGCTGAPSPCANSAPMTTVVVDITRHRAWLP